VGVVELIRADLAANPEWRSKLVMALFRLASHQGLPRAVRLPWVGLYKFLVGWIFGIELPVGTTVGPGLRLNHATGLVVNGQAVLGANCDLKHGCTIGVRRSGEGSPVLEDGVTLGAASSVIGPITLGHGAETGAGAVVLTDVPAGHVAVGNPARVLPRRSNVGEVKAGAASAHKVTQSPGPPTSS
jgi:serine acetyltransferase